MDVKESPVAGRGRRFLTGLLPPSRQLRPLAVATLVSRVANGLLMTIIVLYFHRIIGLTVTQIGLGLTVAGLFGLLSSVPFGHLADLRGPRTLFVLLSATVAALSLLYLVMGTFWEFLLVSIAVAVVDRGAAAVRFALIAAVTRDPGGRVAARAYLRSMTNVGVAAGAGIGAFALHADDGSTYRLMICLYAALTTAAALVVLAIPAIPATPRSGDGAVWIALRDPGYLLVATLNAAVCLHYSVMDVALPVWVVDHTQAPRSTAAVALGLNAVLVACLQVRASRRVVRPGDAGRATRTAGVVLCLSMVLLGAASSGGVRTAVALLVAGAVLLTLGELLQAAGSFVLAFDLAADEAQGQYQGVWNTSTSLSTMVAPAVMAFLPLGLGTVGWVVLGLWFALVGLLFVPAVGWAARRRQGQQHSSPDAEVVGHADATSAADNSHRH